MKVMEDNLGGTNQRNKNDSTLVNSQIQRTYQSVETQPSVDQTTPAEIKNS